MRARGDDGGRVEERAPVVSAGSRANEMEWTDDCYRRVRGAGRRHRGGRMPQSSKKTSTSLSP